MSRVRHIIAGFFITLFFPWSVTISSAEVVYENIHPVYHLSYAANSPPTEAGAQLRLGGTARIATSLEYWAYHDGDTRLSFYRNDGPEGQPDSLIWRSPQFDANTLGVLSIPNVPMPIEFTITFAVSGSNSFLMCSAENQPVGDAIAIWTKYSGIWYQDVAKTAADVSHYFRIYADDVPYVPPQVCYLDFSGYTAPGGYGTTEQIASDVKASVASNFTQPNLTFTTSFDGGLPEPSITSTIHFGGTDPTPTRLGYASYDSGNANRTDTGFVYTDQTLFTSRPTNATEYQNMLSNSASHEIGHLLGYGHGDAAGMPFMLTGNMIEARLLQEMILGELGQVTQQRMSYVVDTDYDPTAPLPPITYMPKTSATPAQRQQMMQEMEDFYRDAGGDGLSDVERVWCTVADVEGVVETLVTGSWKPDPIFDGGCLVLQLNNHPEYVEFFFGAIVFGDKSDELDLADDLTFIQPEWNEALGGYLFRFDGLTEEEILGSDISLTFMAPTDDINDFTLRVLESDLTDLGNVSFVVQNIPEPATLGMLALGGLAMIRRRKK